MQSGEWKRNVKKFFPTFGIKKSDIPYARRRIHSRIVQFQQERKDQF